MVQINRAIILKYIQQCASHAQERQQKHHEKLDEFQDIGSQLAVKYVATLQAIQESRQMVDNKATEEHPVQQTVSNCQNTVAKVQLQVQEVAQQFADFKDKTVAYTLSTWRGSRMSQKILLGACWQGVGVSELSSVVVATQGPFSMMSGEVTTFWIFYVYVGPILF